MHFLDTGRAMDDQRSQKSGEEKLQKGALKFTYTRVLPDRHQPLRLIAPYQKKKVWHYFWRLYTRDGK